MRILKATDEYTCENCGHTHKVKINLDYKNKLWLNSRYTGEGLSMAQLAKMCGVSPTTINKWLIRHSITTRNRGRIRGKKFDS